MSENSNELRVYTIEEAAAILRCEPSWLEEQTRERKVPYLRLAGSQGFTGGRLAAIVAAHEVLPEARRDAVLRRPALAWTAAEAAELLRCKASWLRRKARCHEIPCTMLGGAYHFSDAHLAEVIRILESSRAVRQHQRCPLPGLRSLRRIRCSQHSRRGLRASRAVVDGWNRSRKPSSTAGLHLRSGGPCIAHIRA